MFNYPANYEAQKSFQQELRSRRKARQGTPVLSIVLRTAVVAGTLVAAAIVLAERLVV